LKVTSRRSPLGSVTVADRSTPGPSTVAECPGESAPDDGFSTGVEKVTVCVVVFPAASVAVAAKVCAPGCRVREDVVSGRVTASSSRVAVREATPEPASVAVASTVNDPW